MLLTVRKKWSKFSPPGQKTCTEWMPTPVVTGAITTEIFIPRCIKKKRKRGKGPTLVAIHEKKKSQWYHFKQRERVIGTSYGRGGQETQKRRCACLILGFISLAVKGQCSLQVWNTVKKMLSRGIKKWTSLTRGITSTPRVLGRGDAEWQWVGIEGYGLLLVPPLHLCRGLVPSSPCPTSTTGTYSGLDRFSKASLDIFPIITKTPPKPRVGGDFRKVLLYLVSSGSVPSCPLKCGGQVPNWKGQWRDNNKVLLLLPVLPCGSNCFQAHPPKVL